jgi:hypothetical protein
VLRAGLPSLEVEHQGELRDDGWVSDAVPDAVGIALIVVGAVGSAPMRKVSPVKTEATERQ